MNNPRIQTVDIPTGAPPAEVIAAIGANINDQNVNETAARNYVIRCLAVLGNTRAPEVNQGHVDGSLVRLYTWRGTILGDVILAAGPSFMPKFVAASDLVRSPTGGAVYTLAAQDKTKNAERAADYTQRLAASAGVRAASQVAKEATPPPAAAPRRTATERAPAASQRTAHPTPAAAAPDESAEKAELKNFLSNLLG